MIGLPGTLIKYPICHAKIPESEYDSKGIPVGLSADKNNPYLDSKSRTRYVMVYRPRSLKPMLLTYALYILCDESGEADVRAVLSSSGLVELAERESAFIIFVLPSEDGWNIDNDPQLADDTEIVNAAMTAAKLWHLFDGRENGHDYLMGLVGTGKGADMAQLTVARYPQHVNSFLTFGGCISNASLQAAGSGAEVFSWLVNPRGDSNLFWENANSIAGEPEKVYGNTTYKRSHDNFAKQVRVTKEDCRSSIDEGLLLRFWDEAFSGNVRILSRGAGNVFNCAEIFDTYKPTIHLNERVLKDNGGLLHNWIEFVPEKVMKASAAPSYCCPLIIEMHGGGSVPRMSAAKVQYQKLGEEKGFITVYANASNNNSWNSILRNDRPSDLEYIAALTKYLLNNYPVDPEKVYVSGFSNGSGMAQLMAAAKPELYAGVIAFSTRYHAEKPLYVLAEAAKKARDYRMPVFSSYGTKDHEYPMLPGCGQFTQMTLWKWYNNIDQRELTAQDPSRVGTPGDRVYKWGRDEVTGEPIFTTHCYCSRDFQKINYYNYTLVDGLPHTVEPRLIPVAWDFISQFSRNKDGSLSYRKNCDLLLNS